MAKEKTAKDIAEIIAGQLDIVTSANVDAFALKKAEVIANHIGKLTSLAAMRMKYYEHKKKGGEQIQTLESK